MVCDRQLLQEFNFPQLKVEFLCNHRKLNFLLHFEKNSLLEKNDRTQRKKLWNLKDFGCVNKKIRKSAQKQEIVCLKIYLFKKYYSAGNNLKSVSFIFFLSLKKEEENFLELLQKKMKICLNQLFNQKYLINHFTLVLKFKN